MTKTNKTSNTSNIFRRIRQKARIEIRKLSVDIPSSVITQFKQLNQQHPTPYYSPDIDQCFIFEQTRIIPGTFGS